MNEDRREKRGRVLIIDDDQSFLRFIETYVSAHFPDLEIMICQDPVRGLAAIADDLDLLLLDLEMPGIDGGKILSFATGRGLDKTRIIILSGREADYLHERFPMGSCLAVLNKYEARQKDVLDMVFNALEERCRLRKGREGKSR